MVMALGYWRNCTRLLFNINDELGWIMQLVESRSIMDPEISTPKNAHIIVHIKTPLNPQITSNITLQKRR
jgi:hypothetical protein